MVLRLFVCAALFFSAAVAPAKPLQKGDLKPLCRTGCLLQISPSLRYAVYISCCFCCANFCFAC